MRIGPSPSARPWPHLPALLRLATPDRLRRYPLILLVVTAGLYAVTVLRSNGPIEPNGKIFVDFQRFSFSAIGKQLGKRSEANIYKLVYRTF